MSDRISVGLLSDFYANLDPRTESDFANLFLYWHIYEPPLRPSADGQDVEPCLLDAAPRPVDRRDSTWWARVRPGVRFSDGTKLTARRLVESLRRSPTLQQQIEVDLEGDRIVFCSRRPRSSIEWLLTHHATVAVHESDGRYLGTGPYRVRGSGDTVAELEANPHSRVTPAIGSVGLTTYSDVEGGNRVLIEAINRGEVDLTLALGRDDLRHLRGVHRWMGQGNSVCYLYINTQRPYLRDPKVRRALARGIDRKKLAQVSYSSPLAFAATGLLPPPIGAMPDGLRTDFVASRETFRASPADRSLRMIVMPVARQYLPDPHATAENLTEQLTALGLEIDVQFPRDVKQYMEWIAEGDYDLVLAGWIADTPDAPSFLEAILSSRSVPGADRSVLLYSNKARYRSDEMDAALEAYRKAPTSARLGEISQLVDSDRPLVPLLYGAEIVVSSWKVRKRPKAYFGRAFIADMTF